MGIEGKTKNLELVKKNFIAVLSRPRFKFDISETSQQTVALISNKETFTISFFKRRSGVEVIVVSRDFKVSFSCVIPYENPPSINKLALILAKKISLKPVYDVVHQ